MNKIQKNTLVLKTVLFQLIATKALASGSELAAVINEKTEMVENVAWPFFILVVVFAGLSIPVSRRFGLSVMGSVVLGSVLVGAATTIIRFLQG